MFDMLLERVRAAAERRARERVLELAEQMRADLPSGVEAEAVEGGVAVTGRGLRRRFAMEERLRWLMARMM